MKKISNTRKGFTLLEILLVVAAISILAGIVILAINPTKQLGDTRNVQRRADVTTILNAVYQYAIDNNGVIPASITSSSTEICATGVAICGTYIDLTPLTTNEKYVLSIPIEPQKVNASGAGYLIHRDAFNRVTVQAQYPEQGATISVTR